jgi:hypothetical protein
MVREIDPNEKLSYVLDIVSEHDKNLAFCHLEIFSQKTKIGSLMALCYWDLIDLKLKERLGDDLSLMFKFAMNNFAALMDIRKKDALEVRKDLLSGALDPSGGMIIFGLNINEEFRGLNLGYRAIRTLCDVTSYHIKKNHLCLIASIPYPKASSKASWLASYFQKIGFISIASLFLSKEQSKEARIDEMRDHFAMIGDLSLTEYQPYPPRDD